MEFAYGICEDNASPFRTVADTFDSAALLRYLYISRNPWNRAET